MRFENLILGVGVAATVALAATGYLGYRGGPEGGGLDPHLTLAVGTAMAVLFPHLWVLIYLLASGRGLRRAVAAAGERTASGLATLTPLAGARRWAFVALAAASGTLLALVFSGGVAASRAGGSGGGLHQALFWTALALQAAALIVERRALRVNASLFAALDRPAAA